MCVCVCVCMPNLHISLYIYIDIYISQNRHMKVSLGTVNFLKNNQLPDY